MPTGQAHTIWFPELKRILAEKWNSTLVISQQMELLCDLNKELSKIRTKLAIQPPMMWCPNCQKRHSSKLIEVSITALYWALKRFEIDKNIDINSMKKKWKEYSMSNRIDIYGKQIVEKGSDIDEHDN